MGFKPQSSNIPLFQSSNIPTFRLSHFLLRTHTDSLIDYIELDEAVHLWIANYSQGAITDRTQEHLGVGDQGIIIFRKLLHEQIDKVRKGSEPLGIIRDPQMNRLIEFDVINERIGVGAQKKVA